MSLVLLLLLLFFFLFFFFSFFSFAKSYEDHMRSFEETLDAARSPKRERRSTLSRSQVASIIFRQMILFLKKTKKKRDVIARVRALAVRHL